MKLKLDLRQRRWLRILWLVAVVAVTVGSVLPGSSAPMQALGKLDISDKLMHFAAYAVLAFLPGLHERRPALTACTMFAITLGILLEFAQRVAPERSFELADMLADAGGLLCGLIVALVLRS